jgi:hypothetical protein
VNELANLNEGDTTRSSARTRTLESRMRREKIIGKPSAGTMHARLERASQETEPAGDAA